MKVIKSYTDLYELHEHLRKFDVYHKGEKYRLQLPQLEADENNRITSILNGYSGKCGGNTKNVAMCMAFTIYIIVYYFSEGGTFSSLGADGFISLTVCTLLGAIVGKLSGLIYIRWKMIKFIGKLLATEHSSLYQHSFSKL
jgi:hypothetical protein